MARRLCGEEIVTIRVLARKGQTNSEIARTLGVSEGTIRYQKKRLAEDRDDGRTGRRFKAEAYDQVIDH